MRSIFGLFSREQPDFTEVDAAQARARKGLREAQVRQMTATHTAQRARWSRETNHFSEGMAKALLAPLRGLERNKL